MDGRMGIWMNRSCEKTPMGAVFIWVSFVFGHGLEPYFSSFFSPFLFSLSTVHAITCKNISFLSLLFFSPSLFIFSLRLSFFVQIPPYLP